MRAIDIINKRKQLWNENHNMEVDKIYTNAVVQKILESEDLREEIKQSPGLLIQMVFTVVNKEGETMPFFLNAVQTDLMQKIEEFGGKKPIYVLKGRQQGITTFVTALQLCYSIVRKNFAGFTITDKAENTLAVFQDKAKSVYDRLPEALKPKEKFNNVRELFFEKLNSSWRTATATENVGRSKTLRFLHLSELAFFQCSLAKIQESLGETLPHNAVQIYETTANGYNDAKTLWDKGSCLNVFYEWWMTAEYQTNDLEVLNELSDTWIKERVEWLRNKGLEETQIAWYVKKYNGYINGKDSIRQEYPCYPAEAFLATGECIFNTEELQEQLDRAEKGKFRVGYFKYDKKVHQDDSIEISNIKFVEDSTGSIKIYEEAKEGSFYVIGGDTAGDGSDNFTMQVIDNNTLKQVASFRQCRIDEDLYAEQAYCLGVMYNIALIGIEVNFSTYPTKHLTRCGYTNLYYREMFDEIENKAIHKFGFKTTSQTRPVIISELQVIIRENVSVLQDVTTINECLTFVKNENGKAEAIEGEHDDTVMALAIAYGIRHQQQVARPQPKEKEEILPFALQEEEQEIEWGDWSY
jgi:hypothetical protein